MTETPSRSDAPVRIERVLPAPIDEVFAAWTDPESMSLWLSPIGHAEVEADPRVDGRFRVVMVGGDVSIEHNGKYLVFDPPRLLSFTWRSPYTGPEPSVVTVTLTPEGETTRMVLVHERLPAEQVTPHADGWGSILDRLSELLASVVPDRKGDRSA
jgi:uncharacterized protein YndB with AHSA1/START domain